MLHRAAAARPGSRPGGRVPSVRFSAGAAARPCRMGAQWQAMGCRSRRTSRGPRRLSRASLPILAAQPPAAAEISRVDGGEARRAAGAWIGFDIRASQHRPRRADHPHPGRSSGRRGLPGGAPRTWRPPPRLSRHQLHRLRSALLDRAGAALRPEPHHHAGTGRCAPTARASTAIRWTGAFHTQPAAFAALRPAFPRCLPASREIPAGEGGGEEAAGPGADEAAIRGAADLLAAGRTSWRLGKGLGGYHSRPATPPMPLRCAACCASASSARR